MNEQVKEPQQHERIIGLSDGFVCYQSHGADCALENAIARELCRTFLLGVAVGRAEDSEGVPLDADYPPPQCIASVDHIINAFRDDLVRHSIEQAIEAMKGDA